jgi:zinc transporter 9
MFAEAIHSFADTANQFLLYVGLRRSIKKPDEKYSYGYGGERFFWALVSACGVLFVGAGVTAYHGIHALLLDEQIEVLNLNYWILFVSFVIESYTLYKAVQELRSAHGKKPFFKSLRIGDPVTVAVIYEDTAAVLGVCVAALGLFLVDLTGNALFDGLGALSIAAILAVIAIVLIGKNRQFLLRKAIPRQTQEDIIEMLEDQDCIDAVIDFKSSVLDVGKYHIKCEVEWNTTGILNDIKRDETLRQLHTRVAVDFDEFKKLLVDEAERIPRLIGREIDEIEKRIREQFPEVSHIDIEIN